MGAMIQILSIDELNKITRKSRSQLGYGDFSESLAATQSLWRRLLDTVHHPTVSDKHMTAVCNAVCFVVRVSSCSPDKDLKTFAFSGSTWKDVFHVSRSAFASGKNKPALQVLDTLLHLAEANPDPNLVQTGVQQAAAEMVRIVFCQQPRKALKEASVVLYFFLRKLSDFMCFSDVLQQAYSDSRLTFLRRCRAAKIVPNNLDNQSDLQWYSFILSLLMVIQVAESRSATLKLLSLICTLRNDQVHGKIVNLVSQALDCYGMAPEASLTDVTCDVLPSIFVNQEQFHMFLSEPHSNTISDEPAVQLLLAQLKFGRSKIYIAETDLPHWINEMMFKNDSYSQVDHGDEYHGFRMLLSNRSPAIRQSSFDLLTFSASPKASLSRSVLDCLAESLNYLHEDTDAFYRGELVSTFRRLLVRLHHCRLRSSSKATSDDGESETVDHFLKIYLVFLKAELAPHLSYGRHALALDILCLILETFSSSSEIILIAFAHIDIQRSLFRLVLDPYDDIRSMSAKALSQAMITRDIIAAPSFRRTIQTISTLNTAGILASATNRADHADALGRTISLLNLYKVSEIDSNAEGHAERELCLLAQDLDAYTERLPAFTVSSAYPLHGSILGLSYIISSHLHTNLTIDNMRLQDLLLSSCSRIWVLSHSHLCVDSPEMESEDVGVSQYGPKDLLAYAWRALRDSNLLMQAMLETIDANHSLIAIIGELCFDQLRLLRHRGAFSTVAQTFLLCCQKARNSNHKHLHQLTADWFDKALAELEHQADKLTRRSAGLPAIFIALLDPLNGPQFSASFEKLVRIAAEKPPRLLSASSQANLRLPQVHALNCMKDVMTNSRFRNVTEPLVVLTINIAAKCMSTPIWAIKNCGLMLLRASINRLDPDTGLGTAEGGYSVSSNLPNFETPFDIAMMLLNKSSTTDAEYITSSEFELNSEPKDELHESSGTETEFAALDLLGRLYMVKHEHVLVMEAVTQKLSHHIWHVRAQAARLLKQTAAHGEEVALIEALVDGITDETSSNGCHGRLLAVKFILQEMRDNVDPLEYSDSVAQAIANLLSSPLINRNGFLMATYIEIISQLLDLPTKKSAIMVKLFTALQSTLGVLFGSGDHPRALLDAASATILLQSFPQDSLTNDEDVLSFLRQDEDLMANTITWFHQHQQGQAERRVLTVTIRIICTADAEDVQASAMNAIVFMARPNILHISEDEAEQLISTLRFNHNVSRRLMTSQLKLFAWLCVQAWLLKEDGPKLLLSKMSNGFCMHMRVAVNDEYEESTRKDATEALLLWTKFTEVSQMMQTIFGKLGQFDISCAVYDLLNDDDEDIRESSTSIAARLSNSSMPGCGVVQILGAAASREKLRNQLFQHFGQGEDLLLECLRRLLGLKMTASRFRLKSLIECHMQSSSVKDATENIMAASTDLFAEEKQNLYIDEVAEIKDWAQLMCSIPVKMPSRIQDKVKIWVGQGLGCLVDLLQHSEGNIAIGYSIDLDVLLIRLTIMARVVGLHNELLETLNEKCRASNISAAVVSAFTWSLR